MFEQGERTDCPVCGVALSPFEALAMSDEGRAEDGAPTAPELERLPWTYFGRARGPLVAVALAGLLLFVLPWIHLTFPYVDSRSALDLAKGRLFWMWAAGSAWLVLIPTVMSRRNIIKMRGARVASAFLSAVPAVAVAILMAFPPRSMAGFKVHFTFGWPVWGTLILSAIGIVLSTRLGGRVDDIRVRSGNAHGQTLH
jgi:hypothetical protein